MIFPERNWKSGFGALTAISLSGNSAHTGGEHHLTIPNHNPLRPGTLRAILGEVMAHHHHTLEQVMQQLGLS